MALVRASASAVRRLNATRRGDRVPQAHEPAMSSTAGPTYSRVEGTSRDNSTVGPAVRRRRSSRLEGSERLLGGAGDREERVELGQLEQRLEVFVETRQAQLSALFANLFRQGDQDA